MATFVGQRNARVNLMAVLLGQVPAAEVTAAEEDGVSDEAVTAKPGKKKVKAAREYCYAVRAVDEGDRVTRTHDQMNQRCGGGHRVFKKKLGS